jgi:hypothetical protein
MKADEVGSRPPVASHLRLVISLETVVRKCNARASISHQLFGFGNIMNANDDQRTVTALHD